MTIFIGANLQGIVGNLRLKLRVKIMADQQRGSWIRKVTNLSCQASRYAPVVKHMGVEQILV